MKRRYYLLVLIIVAAGCKKPYNPPVIALSGSYLVVEGVINNGTDSTFIKLSRTVKLSSRDTIASEANAVVAVESSGHASYPLIEISKGTYASPGLNLDQSQTYRLVIKTSGGKQYASDFIQVLNSPLIDSVSFTLQSQNVNINLSTHDPNNIVKYYRWDYQETYLIHPEFLSSYIATTDTILPRFGNGPDIYNCWKSDTSSSISLGSTAKLTKSIIVNTPITYLPANVQALRFGYSINVRQYALTGDAFTFWQNLKTTTEKLGSIFDALPTQINGNIHSLSNPAEPVIGYISVGNVTSKRIFISPFQLPLVTRIDPYASCVLDTFYYHPKGKQLPVSYLYLVNGDNQFVPIQEYIEPFVGIAGYIATISACGDCRLYGTNVKPSFWK